MCLDTHMKLALYKYAIIIIIIMAWDPIEIVCCICFFHICKAKFVSMQSINYKVIIDAISIWERK